MPLQPGTTLGPYEIQAASWRGDPREYHVRPDGFSGLSVGRWRASARMLLVELAVEANALGELDGADGRPSPFVAADHRWPSRRRRTIDHADHGETADTRCGPKPRHLTRIAPTTRLGGESGAATAAGGGNGADRRIGRVAAPASALGGDTARARGPARPDARPGCMPVPSSATSSVAIRSCSPKRSSMAPSIFADWTTAPVVASTIRAVIRSRSPSRWYPPVTSHRTPRRRPTSRTAASPTGTAPMKPTARIASETASRAMSDRGGAREVGHQGLGDASPDPIVTRYTADVVERNDGEHVRAVARWDPDTLRTHRGHPQAGRHEHGHGARNAERPRHAASNGSWFHTG